MTVGRDSGHYAIDLWVLAESVRPFQQTFSVGLGGWNDLGSQIKKSPQAPDRFDHRSDAHDLHHAFDVVGEHVKTHLGTYSRESLG